MKKYNNITKCYKIDIFINGEYFASTQQHKTCKSASESVKTKLQSKSKFLSYYIADIENVKVKAYFDK
jgi:hypothetical protein